MSWLANTKAAASLELFESPSGCRGELLLLLQNNYHKLTKKLKLSRCKGTMCINLKIFWHGEGYDSPLRKNTRGSVLCLPQEIITFKGQRCA